MKPTESTFEEKNRTREKKIVQTSAVGIAANVFLALFKALIGLTVNSIAIVLDAVNNITDAASSLITIVGTKLAGKQPDKKHPFGYGRIEYLSAMVISLLVLYAGITSLTESIKKIIHPEAPDYSTLALVIVAVGVIVKILLGVYVRRTGENVHSESLVNSGKDAGLDAVISAATLVAAGIFLWKGVSLEAYLGAIISAVIIKSGIEMLRETLSELLGERADAALAKAIKETVTSFPDVRGAYDLVLNNYGPDAFNGSIHIEVPDTLDANTLDDLIRRITYAVYEQHNVVLTAIGVYAYNTKDAAAKALHDEIYSFVMSQDDVLQMHGFYANTTEKLIRFDIIIGFDAHDRRKVYTDILSALQARYPDYTLQIVLDTDFSESV